MITLPNKLSKQFITEINNNYNKIKNEFDNNNKNINYINVYHKDWKNKKNNILKNYVDKEIGCKNIISITYLFGPPDCNNQEFHYDYSGFTNSYFIPLIELNNLNGTEYVNFYDKKVNIKFKKKLLLISHKFLEKKNIIEYLKKFNIIYKKDYNFKYLNADPFSVILKNNYIFHRGVKNKLKHNRIILEILCGINENVNTPNKIKIEDAISSSEFDIFCKKNMHLQEWCQENNFKEEWEKEESIKKKNIFYKIIGIVFFIFIIIFIFYIFIKNKDKIRRRKF
jgi:hypothetical protein